LITNPQYYKYNIDSKEQVSVFCWFSVMNPLITVTCLCFKLSLCFE